MTIHYVTSVSQDWRKVKNYAGRLAQSNGVELMEMPARTARLQQRTWADGIWNQFSPERPTLVIVAMKELPMLRLMKRVRQKYANAIHSKDMRPEAIVDDLVVHHVGSNEIVQLRIQADGETFDRAFPEGFFDRIQDLLLQPMASRSRSARQASNRFVLPPFSQRYESVAHLA